MKTQDDIPDEVRNNFCPGSPQHSAYMKAFHAHSHELVTIFTAQPGILLMWDELMNEFNTNELMTGKVSQQSNARMKTILDEVRLLASDTLKSAIDQHKKEIDYFPDTMAFLLFSFYFF